MIGLIKLWLLVGKDQSPNQCANDRNLRNLAWLPSNMTRNADEPTCCYGSGVNQARCIFRFNALHGVVQWFAVAFSFTLPIVASAASLVDRQADAEQGLLPFAAEQMGVPASIADRMKFYGVPGLSIAVIDGGRIVWAKGYGVADTRSGKPVRPTTLFQAASISKPISALGALLLAQSGKLVIDRSVNDQLSSWKIPENELTRDRPVTPRMLMNHSAGLDHCRTGSSLQTSVAGASETLLQMLEGVSPALAAPVCVVSTPGEKFDYSNAGYEVLQQLMTDVAQKPFEHYMTDSVLKPLGMRHSRFAQHLPAALKESAATGHRNRGEALPQTLELGPNLSVGGLWSTPMDIAAYILNVQQAHRGQSKTLLKTSLVQDKLRPGLGSRGLGPHLSGTGRLMRFGHDGGQQGFESTFTAYLYEGRGAVVMANSEYSFMLILEVMESIRRAYNWPDFGETAQRPPSSSMGQVAVRTLSSKNLIRERVRFEVTEGVTLVLHSRGTRLFVDGPGFGTAEVFETADGRLFCPQLTFSDLGSPWMRFEFNALGEVTKLRTYDDGSVVLDRLE